MIYQEPRTPMQVRDAIRVSWRRSLLAGVSAYHLEPQFHGDINDDGRLVNAARPVIGGLSRNLAGSPVSVILTDHRGFVLERRAGEYALNRHLDDLRLTPGYSYAEEYVGTNGIGTALEEGRASHVVGAEHFSGALQRMSCAGAPIRDLNGRLAGVLDLTCFWTDTRQQMLTLARQAAADVEQQLVQLATERDRILQQEFLAACRQTSRPIIGVNENLVIANARASNLLNAQDHLALRQRVEELVHGGASRVVRANLSSDRQAMLHCRTLAGSAGIVGAIVMIEVEH